LLLKGEYLGMILIFVGGVSIPLTLPRMGIKNITSMVKRHK